MLRDRDLPLPVVPSYSACLRRGTEPVWSVAWSRWYRTFYWFPTTNSPHLPLGPTTSPLPLPPSLRTPNPHGVPKPPDFRRARKESPRDTSPSGSGRRQARSSGGMPWKPYSLARRELCPIGSRNPWERCGRGIQLGLDECHAERPRHWSAEEASASRAIRDGGDAFRRGETKFTSREVRSLNFEFYFPRNLSSSSFERNVYWVWGGERFNRGHQEKRGD